MQFNGTFIAQGGPGPTPGQYDLCVLADVKDNLNIQNTNSDTSLQSLITRASQFMMSEMNRGQAGLYVADAVERRNGNNYNQMVMRFWPIISVTSVTVNNRALAASPDGVTGGFINDDFTIFLVAGGIFGFGTPNWFLKGFQNVLITYTYGFLNIPGDITQATIELVSQKFKRRAHIDQDSQTLNEQTITFSKKDIPPEVQTVINNYKIHGFLE